MRGEGASEVLHAVGPPARSSEAAEVMGRWPRAPLGGWVLLCRQVGRAELESKTWPAVPSPSRHLSGGGLPWALPEPPSGSARGPLSCCSCKQVSPAESECFPQRRARAEQATGKTSPGATPNPTEGPFSAYR